MSGMEYTKENAKRLEKIYLTSDVKAQRAETIRQLDLSAGESVLDIGCGPGYLCESMAQIVGRDGAVVGIDVSDDLIAVCNRQKASPWISYAIGDATALSQSDASFDAVVCTQVAEYVPDVDRVLIEAFRVLKPGGRTIFVATDWDAVVWHSEDRERMTSVMKSWESHCAHPHLPRSMARRLANAGFHLDGASIFPILNLQYDEDSYSKGLAEGIRNFVGRKNDVSADDLNAWQGEFERLSGAGRYFFSTSRYIFRASKPAAARI
ncbi:methyltransferase domain-containing protein [Bradyrhizobium sp. CB1650]|uniref:methyltransferase domain-containing protein n=1 Tax=Bradyrhizobium sp. CB1650 TaxID=3039153 RepID=UPI0024351B0E|nr:methyltransferase domain-containing protein [Bradyrhizobium sp. CB1650]WGD48834.1 methyltransferase domain-containing protein [Bradyrhizobium sp. CB1650]